MFIKDIAGKPVLDAKAPVTIHICAADIAKADVKRPESCAAARAILRDCHALEARVHLGRVYIRRNQSNWTRYITPKALRTEIIAFDRGGKFEPGDYALQAPPPKNKATGKRQGGRSKNTPWHVRKLRKPRPQVITKNVRSGPA